MKKIFWCTLLLFSPILMPQMYGQSLGHDPIKSLKIGVLWNIESFGVSADYLRQIKDKRIFHHINFNYGHLMHRNLTEGLSTNINGDIVLAGYNLGYTLVDNFQQLPIELSASLGVCVGYENKAYETIFERKNNEKFIYGIASNLALAYHLSPKLSVGLNYYYTYLFDSIYRIKPYNYLSAGIIFLL